MVGMCATLGSKRSFPFVCSNLRIQGVPCSCDYSTRIPCFHHHTLSCWTIKVNTWETFHILRQICCEAPSDVSSWKWNLLLITTRSKSQVPITMDVFFQLFTFEPLLHLYCLLEKEEEVKKKQPKQSALYTTKHCFVFPLSFFTLQCCIYSCSNSRSL